ncbi:MAG: GNAT family N-acetyltransferase [Cellulomonadaceae bacterium]|nr:GNAT family N-acetyltransferase [Cellulomonadaceae bacterium]
MPHDLPPLTFRPVDLEDDAELDAYMANTAMVFTSPVVHGPEMREFRRPTYRTQRLTAAFDHDALVATYRSWDWQVTVPGGATVTADAVSTVTVRPTHRRRGALTGLITADLAAAKARGVPAAVLVASEASIYGRYGFGVATRSATWDVDVRSAKVGAGVPRVGTVEVVDLAAVRQVAPVVFEASRRPGATDRSEEWWDVLLRVTPWPGDKPDPAVVALYRDGDGTPRGYAVYSWKDDWADRRSHTVVTLLDLQAATGEAYAGLWRFLTELDLVATVRGADRPVDEELPHLLVDARAARASTIVDLLWARVLDPVAALSARTYESPGAAVLEVTDPLGHAAGRFALVVDGTGAARVGPTDSAVDVTLGVDVLSSLWLGGGDLHAAAVAGRVVEHAAGAVANLDRLMRTSRAPWTGTWF